MVDRGAAAATRIEPGTAPPPPAAGTAGLKVGDFGLFASALLSVALGLAAFCASCFAAIFGILAYNQLGHHAINFADSYRFIALPVGLAVFLASALMLAALWVRRMLRG